MSTKVIFRKDKAANEVVAVFPQIAATYNGREMTCYAHLGQHSACSKDWYYTTVPAREYEYAGLHGELVARGYDDLVVGRRITQRDDRLRMAESRV
ncbi:hypothetical protein [Mycobacterium colombiense]|uniref:hypothetical protein n=1 Tax=Mycobacterium colombiense TaxID=339268 RepID=UPI001057A0A6|nr:hypothetical protein [Mycobacterium colombiense]